MNPRRPDRRYAVACVAALALFGLSWGLLHVGFFVRGGVIVTPDAVLQTRAPVIDTPVYQRYGNAIARGRVPYRDFRLEYPPGALPAFVLPALGHPHIADFDVFRRRFELLMLLCGLGTVVLTTLSLRSLGRAPGWPLAFVGISPLLLGPVVLARFDLWPAMLVAGALAALVAGRSRLGAAVLGVAVAAKVYPVVIAPLAVARAWRAGGRRAGLGALAWLAGAVALVVVPFLALSPGGIWYSVVRQSTRPLQIESVGASFLLAAHQLGATVTMRSGSGSQNLVGTGADVLAALHSVVEIAFLVGLWVAFARGPADRDRLVRFSAAAVCGFVVLGKVLSPQFLIWLVPLVPLVRGRRGLAATALLGAAMLLTQGWFPYRYWSLALDLDATASWLVLVRDLVLLVVLAVLAWPERSPEMV